LAAAREVKGGQITTSDESEAAPAEEIPEEGLCFDGRLIHFPLAAIRGRLFDDFDGGIEAISFLTVALQLNQARRDKYNNGGPSDPPALPSKQRPEKRNAS